MATSAEQTFIAAVAKAEGVRRASKASADGAMGDVLHHTAAQETPSNVAPTRRMG